jgi:hypothetical protein
MKLKLRSRTITAFPTKWWLALYTACASCPICC